jgi:hypothetical protein
LRGGEVRAGRREGLGWWRHTTGMYGETARLKAWGPRARAERTPNMLYMVVTLEVSQPEMSALKFPKFQKISRMSVMAETHQSAMGPYFAMAAVGFELNSQAAVCREALVVKVSTMQAGEGEGGSGEGGEGDGGGGEGDGGGGEGDGGGWLGDDGGELASQQVFLHVLRCLAFAHLLTFLHFFAFAVSVRPLQRRSWTSWARELISVC